MTQSSLFDRLRAWSALLPLLLLLAGTYWLNQQVLPLPPRPDYKARHDPDIVINNFSATTLDELGKPRFMVAAQKMEHYPDDDTTYLDQPRLTGTAANQPPIHISADTGEVSHNGDEITLGKQVKIVREASATQDEMVLTTPYLHVVPGKNLVDTDRPVTLESPRGVINAVGMTLDSKTRVFELLAQVRGQYEPVRH